MIKLIAIDMDGTLLDSKKRLPKENIEAIHRAIAKGIKIVLCTGRAKSGVLPYFEELGLPSQEEEYAILDNGCTTYRTKDWSLLAHRALTHQNIEELVEVAGDYPELALTFFDQSHYFVLGERIPELVAYDATLVFNKVTPTTLEALKTNEEPIFQSMYVGEKDLLDKFVAQLDSQLSQSMSMVRSQDVLYEAMPQGTTKASALKGLADYLDLTAENIMAIGDAANDAEMLDFAGLGVAMGNASQDIKDLADAVTLDNDQAGLARALEKFVL